jgi:ATP-dependent Clp protease ATP-binding subunit ClpC
MTDRYLPDKAIDLIDEACSAKSMTYNQSEDEVHKIKEDMEKLQKEIDGFVTAQQFLKAFKAKEKLDSLELKIKEKKARRTIPREERLHIMSVDIQRIVNQITGIPSKNLQMEDVKKLQGLEQELTKRII